MSILVLNLGSSSLKYTLYTKGGNIAKKDTIENLHTSQQYEKTIKTLLPTLQKHIQQDPLQAIGHRVVHGASIFTKPTLITSKTLAKLSTLNHLAPLHNPINILGIQLCQKYFPKIPNIAIFDTAFHESMKPENYLYALPAQYTKKYAIRKYGFHGISHQYLYETALKKKIITPKNKVITCHLGNGCSITAIKNHKVIETSMGMTPTDGLMMSTRSGSIDPTIITYLSNESTLTPNQINDIMNKQSGLLAISGTTGDMKKLLELQNKDPKAKLAIIMFIESIVKYIGAYTALMDGVDTIIFSGGIGERSSYIRNQIKKRLKFLNKTKYTMIHTDESKMIYQEVKKIVK